MTRMFLSCEHVRIKMTRYEIMYVPDICISRNEVKGHLVAASEDRCKSTVVGIVPNAEGQEYWLEGN